jgi:hypothetical protein
MLQETISRLCSIIKSQISYTSSQKIIKTRTVNHSGQDLREHLPLFLITQLIHFMFISYLHVLISSPTLLAFHKTEILTRLLKMLLMFMSSISNQESSRLNFRVKRTKTLPTNQVKLMLPQKMKKFLLNFYNNLRLRILESALRTSIQLNSKRMMT